MTSPASILVTYASLGTGHRLAAEALAHAIREIEAGPVRVDLVDVLDGCSERIVRLAARDSAPGSIISAALTPWLMRGSGWFASLLTSKQPAAVVSTHPHPTKIAARLASHGRIRARVVSVPTHFSDTGPEATSGIALYCASSPSHADALAARGVARGAIALTGIPVRAQFTAEYDTLAAREHFGLPHEGRVVVAFASSEASTTPGSFDEALLVALPALASLPDTTLAVIIGDNARLAAGIASRAKGFGTRNVKVFQRVEHVAPLLACADLVLTRPTGLVCAECVDSLVPLMLVGPEGRSQQATALSLESAGAAVFVRDSSALSTQVSQTLAAPSDLDRMRQAATELARPFAATDIAERALELAGVRGNTAANDAGGMT